MALIDKKILTPIRYHQDNANTVIGQASTMKALFDQGAEDLRVELNGVIDELLATTGAQQIGIDPARGLGNTLADALTNIKNYMNLGASGISATTIGTGSGNTVQSQLEWLLLQIQNVVLNQIPDGTVTMDKLSTTLADLINGHTTQLAQIETQINYKKSMRLDSDSFGVIGTTGKLFIDRIARARDCMLTNKAVSSSTSVDVWIKLKDEIQVPTPYDIHVINIGLNDVRKWGDQMNYDYRLSHFINSIVAFLRLKELHITTDASISYNGVWQSYALPESFSTNRFTNIQGNFLEFNFEGDNLTIGTYSSVNSGTMRVTIDGVIKLEINLASGHPTLYSIIPLCFENLGSGMHTCKIEKIDADTNRVVHFEYWGTKKEKPPICIVNGIMKMKTNAYTFYPPNWDKASDILINKANNTIRESLSMFDERVVYINQEDFNPNNYNLTGSDEVHPNDYGHEWLASNILKQWH